MRRTSHERSTGSTWWSSLRSAPSLDVVLKPVTLFSEATRVLLPEMKKAGVQRLVSVTGFGAGDSNKSINILQRLPFKLLLKRAYDDKSVQEQLIEESDLDWLIVRPGVLTSGPTSGKYRVLSKPAEWRNGLSLGLTLRTLSFNVLKLDD